MKSGKEIIVVSPEKYKALARMLAHEISKLPGCNGAFWTIKQFENNEFQLGGNRYAILIGNSDENALSNDFLKVIKNINNQAGACFGFDGSKAVVYGEGILEQEEEFQKVLEKTAAIAVAGAGAFATAGAALAVATVGFNPFFWVLFPMIGLVNLFIRKAREQKLRTEQTKAALTLFLAEHFDDWAGIGK